MPVEAQSDSLAAAVASTASIATSAMSSLKKRSKVSGKGLMMDLVTKIKETHRDGTLSCTTFGMSTSPATKKMKKHISSMLRAQAKSAKNNTEKDELSLLQVKHWLTRKTEG
jgi:hypothetical protein